MVPVTLGQAEEPFALSDTRLVLDSPLFTALNVLRNWQSPQDKSAVHWGGNLAYWYLKK